MNHNRAQYTALMSAATADLDFIPPGRDPQEQQDCWARALNRTTGIPIALINQKIGRQFNKPIGMPCRFSIDGFPFQFTSFPPDKVQASNLSLVLPKGFQIIEEYKHVFAHVDGRSYDIVDPKHHGCWENESILGYWEMKNIHEDDQPQWFKRGPQCCQGMKKVY